MPSLDQLLMDDARRSVASDGATSAFGPAMEKTFSRIRRRRRGGVVVGAVTAVAGAGILVASMTDSTPAPTERVRLAADYHVISAVPAHPGVFYAVGPPGGRPPAGCDRVPHITFTVKRVDIMVRSDVTGLTRRGVGVEWVVAPDKGYRIPPGLYRTGPAHHRRPFPSLVALPSGRYAVFTCRTG